PPAGSLGPARSGPSSSTTPKSSADPGRGSTRLRLSWKYYVTGSPTSSAAATTSPLVERLPSGRRDVGGIRALLAVRARFRVARGSGRSTKGAEVSRSVRLGLFLVVLAAIAAVGAE